MRPREKTISLKSRSRGSPSLFPVNFVAFTDEEKKRMRKKGERKRERKERRKEKMKRKEKNNFKILFEEN